MNPNDDSILPNGLDVRSREQILAAILRDFMDRTGLRNSDIAKRAFGTDKRGYARGRDSIGHYVNGTRYPTPKILEKVLKAVDLTVDDLPRRAPDRPTTQRSSRTRAAAEFTQLIKSPEHPTKYRLGIDRLVNLPLGIKILEMLEADEAEK